MNSQEFTAKKVEDAIKEGLEVMGLSENQAVIEVLEQGGIFKKAKVKITSKGTEGEKAFAFVEGLTEIMDVKCTIELTEDENMANIEVISVNSGAIIGHRGDVLDAIQYLASIVANEGKEEYKRIVVDCENYRSRRVETLEALAKRMADKAVTNGRRVKLEPMNAFERRVIHAFLTNDERVTTSSFGDEPYRYLTITPKNYKPRDSRDFNDNRGGFNRNANNSHDRHPQERSSGNYGDRRGGTQRSENHQGGENAGRYDRTSNDRGRDDRPSNDKPRDFSPRKKSTPSSFSNFAYLGNSNDKSVETAEKNKDEE